MPELQPMEVIPPPPPPPAPPQEEPPPAQEEEKVVNPFEMLIKAAKMQNPKQFDIPESLMVFAPLPGELKMHHFVLTKKVACQP